MTAARFAVLAMLIAAMVCLGSCCPARLSQHGLGDSRIAESDALLSSYSSLRKTFNTRLGGRYPFGELAAPDADPAEVKAFFADYAARSAALISVLGTSKDSRAAEVIKFLARLDNAAAFLSGNLLGVEPSRPVTISPTFRLMPSVSTGSEQVVSWSFSIDPQASPYRGGTGAGLEWNFGQGIAFALVLANGSEWRPAMPKTATATQLTVAGPAVSFSAGGAWALLRLIETHRPTLSAATDPLDHQGVTLEFRVPTRRTVNDATGATGERGEVHAYLILRLTAMDPKSKRMRTLLWPGGFVRWAP